MEDSIFKSIKRVCDVILNNDTNIYITNLLNGKSITEICNMNIDKEWKKAAGSYYTNNDGKLAFENIFNKIKSNILKQANETYRYMKFEDFLSKMQDKGFKIGYQNEYGDSENNEKNNIEVILYNEENGFIIYASSFASVLDRAVLYGELQTIPYIYNKGDENKYSEIAKLYKSFHDNHGKNETFKKYAENHYKWIGLPKSIEYNPIENSQNLAFNVDIEEGALTKIGNFENLLTIKPVSIWTSKNQDLYFINHYEESKFSEDFIKTSQINKIVNAKLLSCNEAVLNIINDPKRFKTKPFDSIKEKLSKIFYNDDLDRV